MGELPSKIYELLRKNGLNPYVVCGIVGVLLVLFYRKDLLKWSAIPPYRRRFIVFQLLGAFLLIILGTLAAVGIIPW